MDETRRRIGLVTAASLVVANMVGTGIFTTTGFMVGLGAKSGDILLAWLIGGVLALFGALCYGELGANMPHSGGEYYYLHRLIHPALGFLSGWVSLIAGFAAPVAAAALAMNLYVAQIFPGWPVRLSSVLVILLMASIHARGLSLGSLIQNFLTAMKILLIVALIVGFLRNAQTPQGWLAWTPSLWFSSRFAVILIFVSFAYSGWNAASYIGAEIRNPKRTLPGALVVATLLVTCLYLMVNGVYLTTVPFTELNNTKEVAHAVALHLWGVTGGRWVSLVIAIGLLASVSAMTFVGPRVMEAMASDGLFFRSLAFLNRKSVPARAIWLQGGLAAVLALTAAFRPLLIYVGYTLNIFSAMAVAALLRMRIHASGQVRILLFYPVGPLVFIVYAVWITLWSILNQPLPTLSALATLLVGLGVYVRFVKKDEISL